MVILQFSLSALFIVGFLVIQQQINFTQSKNLGYNRENVIQFRWHSDLNRGIVAGLKEIPGVMNASYMSMDFIKSEDNQSGYSWQKQDSDKNYLFHSPRIGYDLIETLRIEMRAGRSFSRDYSTEASKIIINEAAVQMMGLSNPIGQTIEYGSDGDVRQIIGVVKDFHYGSIHEKIKPLIFRFRPYGETMVVRIMAGTETATIKKLKTYYNQFHLGDSFDFSFMDEDYQSLYESEMQVGALSKYFSGMAIILSCLGLFGLAAFTADKRRKEIGIRKVLGLSEFGVIYLLSSDFTKMVLLAIAIALPVSYLIIKNWLNGFAYKINLEPWYFIGTGLITLCIAWLTVSVQAVKAANLNPVDILKDG
ncbi:hypothetical protein KAR48_03255 [bacterium]|nr:hypothetical protein [bacterium]